MSEARKRPIRVLIIDDSATMRGLMAHAIERDSDLEVVGYAGDAYGAREAIKTLDPDVVTLDIEMPRMDGLTFLEKLMRLRPLPVVVVTSKTDHAAAIEQAALRLGAAHCLFKPSGAAGTSIFSALPERIKEAVAQDLAETPLGRESQPGFDKRKIIALGASTGGVDALVSVLRQFPKGCPPVLIVQHMPDRFIRLFAQRLASVCAPEVEIATDGASVEIGKILLAPAGQHLSLNPRNSATCILEDKPPVNGFKPSVDVLFHSVAKGYGRRSVAALLTGMGRDGAQGLLAIHRAGGVTAVQDEETSVVFGMPRVALELGAAQTAHSLDQIAEFLLTSCQPQATAKAS